MLLCNWDEIFNYEGFSLKFKESLRNALNTNHLQDISEIGNSIFIIYTDTSYLTIYVCWNTNCTRPYIRDLINQCGLELILQVLCSDIVNNKELLEFDHSIKININKEEILQYIKHGRQMKSANNN